MAKIFSNILLPIYITLGLGAFLVFVPDLALTWFLAVDDILGATLFALLAGAAVVAMTFVNSALSDDGIEDPDSEPVALAAHYFGGAFRYLFVGLLLAFTLDPMIEVTALRVNDDIPQALMDNLADDVSMFDVWLSSMVIWAYTWLTSIQANALVFLDLALSIYVFKGGFAFLCAGAEALKESDDASMLTRCADWLSGRPGS